MKPKPTTSHFRSFPRIHLLACVAATFLGVPALAEEGRTVRVLTVGNSFANNALTFLSSLAEAAGDTVVIGRANLGGCDLERHARIAAFHEADPADPRGHPYNGRSLKELLVSEPWDFVTIQQVSFKSYQPETFQPHADRLIATIRRYAPQAEILVHQTFAYRDDHGFWGSQTLNARRMYRGLRATYDAFAQAQGLRLIPSADAMELARQDPEWGPFVPDPSFDPETARHPDLPDEKRSLHGGYAWRKNDDGTHRLSLDAGHTNAHGSYLLGCVWYEFLFGKSVVGNPFTASRRSISPEDAAILQRIAHRVVTEGIRPELPAEE